MLCCHTCIASLQPQIFCSNRGRSSNWTPTCVRYLSRCKLSPTEQRSCICGLVQDWHPSAVERFWLKDSSHMQILVPRPDQPSAMHGNKRREQCVQQLLAFDGHRLVPIGFLESGIVCLPTMSLYIQAKWPWSKHGKQQGTDLQELQHRLTHIRVHALVLQQLVLQAHRLPQVGA